MPNILMTLAFQGTHYHGFQVQENALSVCTVFQNALEKALGERMDVKGCSRTDSGVHALGYCVSLHSRTSIPLRRLPLAVNAYLPRDIRVLSARFVPEDFHARYSAEAKQYVYYIYNSPISSPFFDELCWRIGPPLDENRMQSAAQAVVGTHDFASFMSAGSKIENTVRTVYNFSVTRSGNLVRFRICADGYLYNMVRILVGTLAEMGAGRLPAEKMPEILASVCRSAAGPRAPAEGLYLERVYYDLDGFRRGGEADSSAFLTIF